ncbi:MAG: DUF4832 domain-containing protein, partial [Balneolales bacterium]
MNNNRRYFLKLTGLAGAGLITGGAFRPNHDTFRESAQLELQPLNYTENPVDIPNPDRGFVKSNDDHTSDGPLVLPVNGKVAISEWTGDPWVMQYQPLTLGGVNPGRPVVTTNVRCEPGVVQFYIDLRNFSSRSRLNNTGTITYGTTQPITDDALAVLREALLFVREKTGLTVHLRPTYDGMGWSYNGRYDTEPEGMCTVAGFEHLSWIEYHLLQLKPIFHEFEDIIMVIDTGTFGPWGEIHTSTLSRDPEANVMLLNALLDAIPPSRSIMAKAGPYVAWYNARNGTDIGYSIGGHLAIDQDSIILPASPGSPEARFGVFDDSYMRGNFDRDNFFNLARGQNNYFGGELGGGTYDPAFFYTTPPALLYISAFCQTNYLCAEWSGGRMKVLEDFSYTKDKIDVDITFPHNNKTVRVLYDPVYEGKNVLEYFRDRMGYRLVLREAKASEWVNQNGTLRFEGKIQNVGFGPIVNRKNVSVILKPKAGSESNIALTNLDARDWRPDLDSRADNTAAWHDMSFSVNMSEFGNIPAGDYDIYLKINDPKEQ